MQWWLTILGIVGSLSKFLFYSQQYEFLLFIPAVLLAPLAAGFWTVTNSMKADICDDDELKHGHLRREGHVRRPAQPSGAEVHDGQPVPGIGRDVGGLRFPQKTSVATGPKAPCSGCGCSSRSCRRRSALRRLFLLTRYPLTEARMAEIRTELEQRRSDVTGAFPVVETEEGSKADRLPPATGCWPGVHQRAAGLATEVAPWRDPEQHSSGPSPPRSRGPRNALPSCV